MSRLEKVEECFELCYNSAKEQSYQPMFSRDEWKGYRGRYKLKCKCGFIYEAYFKNRGNGVIKIMSCPMCSIDHKGKGFAKQHVLKELEERGLKLISPFRGKSKYHVVQHSCGIQYKTLLEHNHIGNCPYCFQSKHKDNQLAKLLKVCEDNNLTPLFSDYKKSFIDNKRTRFPVKCKKCGEEYTTTFIGHEVVLCPRCCKRGFVSNREIILKEYLESKGLKVMPNYRLHGEYLKDPRNPFELDLYLPDFKIAFELNGYAYHHLRGPFGKPNHYHKMKSDKMLKQGIKLYHLWEFTPLGLCKSIMMSKLGLLTKVYARKLKLLEVSQIDSAEFFNYNHVDGDVKSAKVYGLYKDGVPMCMLSLLKRNIQASKSSVWEIGRFATKRGFTVVGGYSRLLKHAALYLKSIGVEDLVSYCNRDLSPDPTDTFYYKYGFDFIKDSGELYKYWNPKKLNLNGKVYPGNSIIPRQSAQKSILVKEAISRGVDVVGKTEEDLAEDLGMYKVQNSGNFKYSIAVYAILSRK